MFFFLNHNVLPWRRIYMKIQIMTHTLYIIIFWKDIMESLKNPKEISR